MIRPGKQDSFRSWLTPIMNSWFCADTFLTKRGVSETLARATVLKLCLALMRKRFENPPRCPSASFPFPWTPFFTQKHKPQTHTKYAHQQYVNAWIHFLCGEAGAGVTKQKRFIYTVITWLYCSSKPRALSDGAFCLPWKHWVILLVVKLILTICWGILPTEIDQINSYETWTVDKLDLWWDLCPSLFGMLLI